MTEQENVRLDEPVASRLDVSRVLETLDSEMARLEHAVIRSGWTLWAGTAALGALTWLFIALMDPVFRFPWERFIVYSTLLSCVVDLWSAVKQRLIPRAEWALSKGGQYRVFVTKETLPFERALHSFLAVRSVLLLLGCWYLQVVVGVGALVPALLYGYVFLVMCRYLWLNFRENLTSRRRKPSLAYLLGSVASTGVAAWGLGVLGFRWGVDDQTAFKGAAIAVGGLYLIEWMAAPRLELPILERLREIRRQLGFSQITVAEAVERCEIALFGHPSAKFLEANLAQLTKGYDAVVRFVTQIVDHLTILDVFLAKIGSGEVPPREEFTQAGGVVEQIYRIGISAQGHLANFVKNRALVEKTIKSLRESTQNDDSLPAAEQQKGAIVARFRTVLLECADGLRKGHASAQVLSVAGLKHNVDLPDHISSTVLLFEKMLARMSAGGDLAITD